MVSWNLSKFNTELAAWTNISIQCTGETRISSLISRRASKTRITLFPLWVTCPLDVIYLSPTDARLFSTFLSSLPVSSHFSLWLIDRPRVVAEKIAQSEQQKVNSQKVTTSSSSNQSMATERERLSDRSDRIDREREENTVTSPYGQVVRDQPPPPPPPDTKPWGYSGIELMNTGAAFWQNYSGKLLSNVLNQPWSCKCINKYYGRNDEIVITLLLRGVSLSVDFFSLWLCSILKNMITVKFGPSLPSAIRAFS